MINGEGQIAPAAARCRPKRDSACSFVLIPGSNEPGYGGTRLRRSNAIWNNVRIESGATLSVHTD